MATSPSTPAAHLALPPIGAGCTCSRNRENFSHCEANVKSPLDEVLRRGSVSVEPELEGCLVGCGADVPLSCVCVRLSMSERAAFQDAALWAPSKGGWGRSSPRVPGVRRQLRVRDVGG